MSKSLYEEAIEAAEQIKFSAEEKVKQKLVESMSPQIKEMIEKSFLFESNNDEDDNEHDNDHDHDGLIDKDEETKEPDSEQDPSECNEDNEEQFFFGISDSHTKEEEILHDAPNEGVSENTRRILSKLITKSNKKVNLENRVLNLKENTKRLKKALILSESNKNSVSLDKRFLLIYKNLLKEAKNIELNSIIKSDNILLKEFLEITKELKNMSRRRRTRGGFLNESLEDLLETNLFEEDGDEEESADDEEEIDLPEPEDEEDALDNLDLDAEEDDSDDLSDLVRKFIDDAEPLLGAEGEQEFELPDMSDEDEEGEEEDVQEEGMFYETDDDSDPPREDEGRVIEIDENMLRKEIAKMRRIREGEAKDMASHFGGGSLDKEMFVDVDDGDLNVHADHLGREDVPTPKVEAALRKAARTNRMLESKNQQYKKALRTMKGQLSEMNLFNAKLLYANKLMQNRDLSIKQQRHIVESLDEAKTLGEAKILFESLSKSLVKGTPNSSGRTMNESVSRSSVGSSSRPMTSGQPLNEGVALDRWATLAGIRK